MIDSLLPPIVESTCLNRISPCELSIGFELELELKMATHFSDEELEQKYSGMTVSATSHRILNLIAAVKEALATYRLNYMQEPPRNTSFRIIWFPQRNRITPSRTFVVFNRSAPPEFKYAHHWNCSFLEDMFDGAQGNYLETKDSLNIAMF